MKKYKELILEGRFKEIGIENIPFEELKDFVLELAFDTENILVYTFVISKLIQNESAKLHFLASHVLALPLFFFEGAYQAALFHAKRAVELDKETVKYQEYLLFFNKIPEKLISNEEAVNIAFEIIKNDPDSLSAKKVLESHTKK